MPRRTDIHRVLVIGSGPIVIGQACEFDYSGHAGDQGAAREGLEVMLVNSNPATIMTDPELADRTYVEPLTPEVLEQIIEKERPDAILPTVGGQTALNLAVQLDELGILKKYNVELIGASIPAIKVAEDRLLFKDAMREIGVDVPRSGVVKTLDEALAAVEETGFPSIIRPSFTMGGVGGGIAYNLEEFKEICGARPAPEPGPRGAGRGVGDRLEGIRARGDARRRRQLRRHLLDREHRPDGRAHRRQHHRGAGADPDRQGIPADARRRAPHHPPRRRRDRRIEHPVRDQPGRWPDDRDRDEPARVALLGAGVEGHRLPDREDRRQARARLHASTRSRTTSRASRRRRSSRPSTTWWSRSRAGTSRSSRRPIAP